MDVIVTGRRCTISDDFRGKATERIQGIERFRDRVQRVEVQVSATQTKQPDQAMRVEITLIGKGTGDPVRGVRR
jgi:ribosomal subunit interface protein